MIKTTKKIICPLCKRKKIEIIKKLKGINIYQCHFCQLSIIPKNKKTNNVLYPFNDYRSEEEKLRKRSVKLGKIVLTYVNHGKLLDVGAGFGLFSSILAKLGRFHLEIIEPLVKPHYLIKEKINFIHHRITYQKFLQKNHVKKYDLLLMIDILEHFKNPLVIVKKTRKLMKDNSYLVIQTPNYQSLMAKVCLNWSWWMIEDHKVVFSPQSIKKILNLSGYQIVYFKTYEDWLDFKKNLDGNFTSIKIDWIRKAIKLLFFCLFFPPYFLFRNLIWYFGYGGLVFLIAKKTL